MAGWDMRSCLHEWETDLYRSGIGVQEKAKRRDLEIGIDIAFLRSADPHTRHPSGQIIRRR